MMARMDKGYSWIVLCACFLNYLLAAGNTKAYGILYTELLEKYDIGAGNTAWVGSIASFLALFLSPIYSICARHFTFRVVIMTGGLCMCAGFIATSFVQRLELMYLTYGIFVGVGTGLVFIPSITVINFYFDKRRIFANGVLASSSGVGAITLPFLYRYLIQEYEIEGALLIIASLVLHQCIGGALIRQPELKPKPDNADSGDRGDEIFTLSDKDVNSNATVNISETKKEASMNKRDLLKHSLVKGFEFKLLKNMNLVYFIIIFSLSLLVNFSAYTMIPAYVSEFDSLKRADLVLALTGGCEIISRISLGFIANSKKVQERYVYCVCMIFASATSIAIPYATSFLALAALCCVLGLFVGCAHGLWLPIVVDIVGMEHMLPAASLTMTLSSFSVLASQPIVGWIRDGTGNWHASFVFVGVMSLFISSMFIVEKCFQANCKLPVPGKKRQYAVSGEVA